MNIVSKRKGVRGMNDYDISVIIPVYNLESYISKCLDSILAQTFANFEIIIIDDGSTDKTGDIIDQYEKLHPNIKVIHKKNEGVSIARNRGIEFATGKYYLFFDGDDFVEPYCLQELYDIAITYKVDSIINGYYRFENGGVIEESIPRFSNRLYEGDDIFKIIFPAFIGLSYDSIRQWLSGVKGALTVENPALWRSMISAEIIRDNHLYFNPNLKVGEDTLFMSEYLIYANRCYINKKCYYYLVTRETSTIYNYEKKPLAKLEGKINQLMARIELTKKISNQKDIDVTNLWSGTVLMSCLELAFLLSKKSKINFFQRYSLFGSYVKRIEVQDIIRNFQIGMDGGIRKIPFILLKHHANFLLFLSAKLLQIVHYEFTRN